MIHPHDFKFNGLMLGVKIDTSCEPRFSSVEYRNRDTGLCSYRSERLQITVSSGVIIGISGIFFQFQDQGIGLYTPQYQLIDLLGEPLGKFDRPTSVRRAFYNLSHSLELQGSLIQWHYADGIDLFLTDFDPYEGFKFEEHRFWSIAVGQPWLAPV